MDDPRIAHTQYSDYRGVASFDIADGKNLTDLAQRLRVPEGFWPVGFDLFVSGESPISNDRPEVSVSVYAVDSIEYGSGIDDVNQNVPNKGGTLLVTDFSGRIPMKELFAFFKRIHVTGFNKSLQAEKVDVLERQTTEAGN